MVFVLFDNIMVKVSLMVFVITSPVVQLKSQFVFIFLCFVSVSLAYLLLSILYSSEGQTLSLGFCLRLPELIPCEALLPQSASSPKLQKSQLILLLVLPNYADMFFFFSLRRF